VGLGAGVGVGVGVFSAFFTSGLGVGFGVGLGASTGILGAGGALCLGGEGLSGGSKFARTRSSFK
jgi:hypothetical protein